MGHLCRGPETVVVSLNLNQQVGWRSDFSGGDPGCVLVVSFLLVVSFGCIRANVRMQATVDTQGSC